MKKIKNSTSSGVKFNLIKSWKDLISAVQSYLPVSFFLFLLSFYKSLNLLSQIIF